MPPTIILLGRQIPTYGLLSLVGILVSGYFAEHEAVRHGEHPFYMIETLCISAVGVLIGSHLLYGITNLDKIGSWSLFDIFGGAVFYGGLFGGLAAGYWWIKRKGHRLSLYCDLGAMTIPLFHFFGRIGCFFGGCCYGIPWEHGILYHSPYISMTADPSLILTRRVPVQLIEAGLNLALFAFLYFFIYRWTKQQNSGKIWAEKIRGHLMEVYLGVYSLLRFFDEFLRGDALRGIYGPLSTSQWISLVIMLVLLIRCLKGRRTPATS